MHEHFGDPFPVDELCLFDVDAVFDIGVYVFFANYFETKVVIHRVVRNLLLSQELIEICIGPIHFQIVLIRNKN